ncbi:hypothetical protein [Actinomadura litoris]|uniref:hypothetical protein n=1 Tax=Actinomadura litoris TaxID=2678616 RepID=UPI001FA75E5C|nr:hypothetical protein [Actinomadura litoris]
MRALVGEHGPGKRVWLHVGAPTAGDAFLQRALWANRLRLGDVGVCYPVTAPQEDFAAVMDLREMSWGGHRDPSWDGTWERVAGRARDWDGETVVLSQGLLGGASKKQVARAVADLEPAEVHVVFATRDLGWQLILDWQEQVRHTHSITFERFVDDLVAFGIDAPEPYGEMFWGLHDPVRVLATWATAVPKERVHVLTLPPPGGSPAPLWTRFCALTGIDAGACDIEGIDAGEPLSAVEAELLRRLNVRIAPALGADYERMVGDHLVGSGLARAADETGRTPMGLPERHREWAAARTRETAASLRASGYDVAGDLADLTTARTPAEAALLPGDVPEELVAAAAVGAVAHLLGGLARTNERIGLAHLHGEMAEVRQNLERLLEAAAAPSPVLQRAARRATGRRAP